MLHSEQNISDLERTFLSYSDQETNTDSETNDIIYIPIKKNNCDAYIIYLLIIIFIILILIFLGIYFS
jgi:hypothetical protein